MSIIHYDMRWNLYCIMHYSITVCMEASGFGSTTDKTEILIGYRRQTGSGAGIRYPLHQSTSRGSDETEDWTQDDAHRG